MMFDPNDDDVIMEDQSTREVLTPVKARGFTNDRSTDKQHSGVDHKDEPDRDPVKGGRRSEVQNLGNSRDVLRKIWDAPITVGVGELLAVSKEVAQQVHDAVKLKPQPKVEPKADAKWVSVSDSGEGETQRSAIVVAAATSFTPRTRGQLIRVRFECDGIPITAIVDTGSQLNIANKKIWQQALTRPMDITRKITMNDANGGGAGVRPGHC